MMLWRIRSSGKYRVTELRGWCLVGGTLLGKGKRASEGLEALCGVGIEMRWTKVGETRSVCKEEI